MPALRPSLLAPSALLPRLRGLLAAASLVAGLGAAAPALAATHFVTLNAATTGTFTAPFAGGPVTAFSLVFAGTLFDTPSAGIVAPVYRPEFGDFRGAGGGTSSVVNGTASGACAAFDCALIFQDTFPPGFPPREWQVFNFGSTEMLGFGTGYALTPIPLPGAGPLLLLGLAAAGVALRRRR